MVEKITFEIVEGIAKSLVEKTKGNLSPILVTEKGIFDMNWDTRADKERILQDFRNFIQESKFEKYWFMGIGYESTNLEYAGRAEDDPNRKESLQVCEYRSDGTYKVMRYYYTIRKGEVIWREQREIKEDFYSHWNFYLEDVASEIVEKALNEKKKRR